ncbi:MAG: hypothetical protein ACOY4R_00135 [Pseudomonadota bacterium]
MRALWPILATAGLAAAAAAQDQDPSRQWILPSAGFMHGSKAVIEHRACCGPTVHDADLPDSDSAALARWSGLASRAGGVLSLKLAGNRTLTLTDCDERAGCEPDDTRVHRLVDRWPQQGLYVVSVGLYEESIAYLVSEHDGGTLVAIAPPVKSPSGRQAVALVSNLLSGVTLQIIDLSSDPPTTDLVTAMPDCGNAGPPAFLRPLPVWTDDTHVAFEGESPLPSDNPHAKQLLRVEGGRSQWQC